MLTVLLLATQLAGAADPVALTDLASLRATLSTQTDAAAMYASWADRTDLRPDQRSCLASPVTALNAATGKARAAQVRLKTATDPAAVQAELAVLAATVDAMPALLASARTCLACPEAPAATHTCRSVPRLQIEHNEVRGYRHVDDCSTTEDYVCRQAGSVCPCTEATLQDWLGS